MKKSVLTYLVAAPFIFLAANPAGAQPADITSITEELSTLEKKHSQWESVFAEQLQNRADGLYLPALGVTLDRESKLGEGTHADFYKLNKKEGVKVAYEPEDIPSLKIEVLVYNLLQEKYPSIAVLPISQVGPEAAFLVKPLVRENQLAPSIKESLTKQQERKLEQLFNHSYRFAQETGIGLDLKPSNLAWIRGNWVLIEAGPRITSQPYSYTLENKSFEEFYSVWRGHSPKQNRLSISDWQKQYRPEQVTELTVVRASPDKSSWRALISALVKDAPSYEARFTQTYAGRDILGRPEWTMYHDLALLQLVKAEGRFFANEELEDLKPGYYNFVITKDGDIFAAVDPDLMEIGMKHFILAQGHPVVAAGELLIQKGEIKLSLESGSYTKRLLKNPDFDEAATALKAAEILASLLKQPVAVTHGGLLPRPEQLDAESLRAYCRHKSFYVIHQLSICQGYKKSCDSALTGKAANQ